MTEAAKLRRTTGATGATAARRARAMAERCRNIMASTADGRSDAAGVVG